MKKIGLLILFLTFGLSNAQQTANEILDIAYNQAKIENKNVLLMFHASWCGWCKRMASNMEDPLVKEYFDQNFVKTFLTVLERPEDKHLETPGGEMVLSRFDGIRQGLPYWLILSSKGEVLADSIVNGENLGCPADEEEVAALLSKLENVSPNEKPNPELIKEVFILKKKS